MKIFAAWHRLLATLLAAVPLAAAPAGTAPVFHLAGQTGSGGLIWAERCGPHDAPRVSPVVWAQPQPDRGAVAALRTALRRGAFDANGVRVVDSADGPLLRVAGARPGEPGTYFRICHVAIHTAYD